VDVLCLLCDCLLDQPHVHREIERRAEAGLIHEGPSGAPAPPGLACVLCCVLRSPADKANGRADANPLVKCATCAVAFHTRCLGLAARPEAGWACPECALGGRGEAAGVRVPAAALLPGRAPLYLLHGSLLEMPHPGVARVPHDEDLIDCGLLWRKGPEAWALWQRARAKAGPDACHPAAVAAFAARAAPKAVAPAPVKPEAPRVDPAAAPAGAAAGAPEPAVDAAAAKPEAAVSAPGVAPATPPAAAPPAAPPTALCTPWTYRNAYAAAWPEAARVLQESVDESKKLKRRGTANVVVFAGMPVPDAFEFPHALSPAHALFLALAARQAEHQRAGGPPLVRPCTLRGARALRLRGTGGSPGGERQGETARRPDGLCAQAGRGRPRRRAALPTARRWTWRSARWWCPATARTSARRSRTAASSPCCRATRCGWRTACGVCWATAGPA